MSQETNKSTERGDELRSSLRAVEDIRERVEYEESHFVRNELRAMQDYWKGDREMQAVLAEVEEESDDFRRTVDRNAERARESLQEEIAYLEGSDSPDDDDEDTPEGRE
ncbi:MAG: hypothetical protein LBJ48_05845 [Coriobacteriales bacterium]|nr:hypothetical protein [Coriobacteriales bacterium]